MQRHYTVITIEGPEAGRHSVLLVVPGDKPEGLAATEAILQHAENDGGALWYLAPSEHTYLAPDPDTAARRALEDAYAPQEVPEAILAATLEPAAY